MGSYFVENFDERETNILRRYFTNLDKPVFGLVNLPEVVKGALFARYSRSPKSLRRLFLDEFVGELDISGDQSIDATVGMERAEKLYDKVFFEYGDDSVAQLGGVHIACEQASNLLTKILEWGRLAAYLEQSTRYIAYDSRPNGRYKYARDDEIMASNLGTKYISGMDYLFDNYSKMYDAVLDFVRKSTPKDNHDSDFVYRMATKAKALDAVRGVLPSSAQSNVGIYATGQSYEQLLNRMYADPLPEAREFADMMLTELRKIIPSFVRRVDMIDRGMVSQSYLADNRKNMQALADKLIPSSLNEDNDTDYSVELIDYDPDAEIKLVASMLYPYSNQSESKLETMVSDMSQQQRLEVIKNYIGERSNRRHIPGRALERPFYRFDILADYGAFRDLQRHRMLTVEWQKLTPKHGFKRPELIDESGLTDDFNKCMDTSQDLFNILDKQFQHQSSYAVCMAYNVRFYFNINARSAMHTLELRSVPQGHPAYRKVAQDMHRLIAEKAGHTAIAEAMSFVNHSNEAELERLEAERNAEKRRLQNN